MNLRFTLGLMALALTLGGCRRVELRPSPEEQVAGRWRMESDVNWAIDQLVFGPMPSFGSWGVFGAIPVTIDGVTREYSAVVIATRPVEPVPPGRCRASAWSASLFAWRPRDDSLGIDAVAGYGVATSDPDDAVLGPRRQCPVVGAFPDGPRFSLVTVVEGKLRSRAEGTAGQLHLNPIEALVDGPPCRYVTGLTVEAGCDQVSYGVTIRATAQARGDRNALVGPVHQVTVGPGLVPGLRFTCGPWRFTPCGPSLSDTATRLPPKQWSWGSSTLGCCQRFLVAHGADSVLRSDLLVRFTPGATDSAVAATLARLGGKAIWRSPLDFAVVMLPDPGPAPGAFDRALARLRDDPDLAAAYPIAWLGDSRWLPRAEQGRIRARLVDADGTLVPSARLCLGNGPLDQVDPRWCRAADATGVVVFDSLLVFDYQAFAACRRGDGRFVAWDSTVVAVWPSRTSPALFGPPGRQCHTATPDR
ncbi:MAG: hypothetical protein R2909_02205 [Gemmatimonadales bacterium]